MTAISGEKGGACLCALFFLFSLLLMGCQTGKPASASFASVNISGKSSDEICRSTAKVFQEDGYRASVLTPASMVFEREGTQGQSLAYSGLVDTYYGAVTLVRVRAQLVDLGEGTYRLKCQAFMVRNAGDSFFEDESRLLNIRSRPYQELLDKVAKNVSNNK